MATLKDVQLKIASVKKTKQITKAMNMVATSRLRGAQMAMDAFRPYAAKFSEVLGSVAGKAGEEGGNALFTARETVKKIHIVLCTSDRGLAGGFNYNLIEKAEALMAEKGGEGVVFTVTSFGKKGRDWARKEKLGIDREHLGVVGGKIAFSHASVEGKQLIDGFLGDQYDEVYIVFAEFVSRAKQKPAVRQLLPIPPIETEVVEAADEDAPYLAEHLCEPSVRDLLGDLLPRNVYVQIFSALLETSTSEHAARMMAMDNATNACNDMIGNLTQLFNKARQAAITADLMDIVGGAEALKG